MPWPSVWRFTVVETGPRQVEVERDPRDIKVKNRKRAMWHRSRGVRLGDRPGGPSGEEIAAKKGQGRFGVWWKEDQKGGRKKVQCHKCGGDHFVWG